MKFLADALNHSFVTSAQANVTPTGRSKTTDSNIKKYLLPRQVNSIFLSPTTPEEILTLINGLDSKKSCGHDDIPVRTLKLSKCLLAPLTSNVINKSICDGVFPDNLKIAKVAPIFKSGDSEIPTNCRPISVLTYFSKIFEKVPVRKTERLFYQKQFVESAAIRFSQQPFHIPGYYRLVRKPFSEPR